MVIYFIVYVRLQQCLPFTVLKPIVQMDAKYIFVFVATVLTVHGIETGSGIHSAEPTLVATVLTIHGMRRRV